MFGNTDKPVTRADLLIPTQISYHELHVESDKEMNHAYPNKTYWKICTDRFTLLEFIEGDKSYAESLILPVKDFYNGKMWENQMLLHLILAQIFAVNKYFNQGGKVIDEFTQIENGSLCFLMGRLTNIQIVIKDIMNEHFTFVPRISVKGLQKELNNLLGVSCV